MASLQTIQSQQGAQWVPFSLDTDRQAIARFSGTIDPWQEVDRGALLFDLSPWGIIGVGGSDRTRFLHNQTTNDLASVAVGSGCETVFVNSTARTLDLATVYVKDEEILVLAQRGQFLMDWMDRFLFPMDKVKLADRRSQFVLLNLVGAASGDYLQALGLKPELTATHSHQTLKFAGETLVVALGNSLALPGHTLLVPHTIAPELWQNLTEQGAIAAGLDHWESLRLSQGRPQPLAELTEDHNPLEAGLWHCLSFDKGCYIGQETIARLHTYQGVKQRLWGMALSAMVAPGAKILVDGQKAGLVTSVGEVQGQPFALGYVRTKLGGAGLTVEIEGIPGKTQTLPFIDHTPSEVAASV